MTGREGGREREWESENVSTCLWYAYVFAIYIIIYIFLWANLSSSSGLFTHCTSGCFHSLLAKLCHAVLSSQPKPTWTLILGSGMISLLEPRRCRAGIEERCVTGSTLDLKLAVALARSLHGFGLKLKHYHLWRICLFSCFFNQTADRNTRGDLSTGTARNSQCYKYKLDAEIAAQTYENIFKETTWDTPTTISLAQNIGPALREAMQVLSYPKDLHRPAN